jgi:hypothetical protein
MAVAAERTNPDRIPSSDRSKAKTKSNDEAVFRSGTRGAAGNEKNDDVDGVADGDTIPELAGSSRGGGSGARYTGDGTAKSTVPLLSSGRFGASIR